MSKEVFLGELQKHLEILEDDEQQDILEEYAQHIDIKMQNGQSEEDAIRDFGPVKELAAEILEAYHVKPEFGEEKRRKRLPIPGGAALEKGGMGLQSLGGFLKEKTTALFRGAGNLFRKAGRSVKNLGLRIKESMSVRKKGRPDAETGGEDRMEMTGNLRMAEGRSLGKGISGACRTAARGLGAGARWCLRLCWNFFWMLFGAGAGCLGLFALFGFGTVLILLLQGYPLAGAVLICLGAFLASGSLAGICFGMLRGRGKRVQAAAEKVLEKELEKELEKKPGMDEEVLS